MKQDMVEDGNEEKQQSGNSIIYFIKYVFIFIYQFLVLFIVMMGLSFFSLFVIMIKIFKKEFDNRMPIVIYMIISSSSILYTIIMFFFIKLENDLINVLFSDGIQFLFSVLLVANYLIVNTNVLLNKHISEIILPDQELLWSFLSTISFSDSSHLDNLSYFLDYNFTIKNKYFEYEPKKEFPAITLQFSKFIDGGEPSNPVNDISLFFQDFNEYLYPNIKHFSILSGVLIIKITFTFIYIYNHSLFITTTDIINIIMIFFVYLYISFLLNKNLGNNDLRRKKRAMQKFNDYINFQDVDKINYQQKLDITCPVSFENWDNAKKFILSFDKEYLAGLEIAYFCLIFYYLFVSIVCLSNYFDLNWLIDENSPLQKPIIVIISSFNFIFLTVFLIFRFQSGTEFNDSFGEIEESMTYLLDVVSDLDTLYDELFINEINVEQQEQIFSAHGLIIKRIKLQSEYYIKNQIKFQNKIYKEDEKEDICRKIIKKIKKNIVKIKFSIQSDKEQFKYQFVNAVEVNIKDFLFTLTIGLVTTLPTIVPKFINFYKQQE